MAKKHNSATREPGAVIGDRYKSVRRISDGRRSSVYEARHWLTDQRVALKIVATENSGRRQRRERFDRSMKVLAGLTSDHVVGLLDAGHDDEGSPFMVMEYLDGITLEELLAHPTVAGTGLGGLATAELAISMLLALREMHTAGLYLRNMHPKHVILHRRGIDEFGVKLIDFGVVGSLGSQLTSDSSVVGLSTYMSPEHARNADMDGRSDLYSLGAMLYHALEGRFPFPADNVFEAIAKHVSEAPPAMAAANGGDLEKGLATLILTLMAKSPHERPQNARVTLDHMRSVLGTIRPSFEALEAKANAAQSDAEEPESEESLDDRIAQMAGKTMPLITGARIQVGAPRTGPSRTDVRQADAEQARTQPSTGSKPAS